MAILATRSLFAGVRLITKSDVTMLGIWNFWATTASVSEGPALQPTAKHN
jgi:hypothetical protein